MHAIKDRMSWQSFFSKSTDEERKRYEINKNIKLKASQNNWFGGESRFSMQLRAFQMDRGTNLFLQNYTKVCNLQLVNVILQFFFQYTHECICTTHFK